MALGSLITTADNLKSTRCYDTYPMRHLCLRRTYALHVFSNKSKYTEHKFCVPLRSLRMYAENTERRAASGEWKAEAWTLTRRGSFAKPNYCGPRPIARAASASSRPELLEREASDAVVASLQSDVWTGRERDAGGWTRGEWSPPLIAHETRR